MNTINKVLEGIGLKDHEISVYLSALELGESTVLPIALKAGVKRTYCYDILSDLQDKGLIYYLEKNNRRRYIAENPQKIEQILKDRMVNFKTVLPDLRAIYNKAPNKPKMRYFEGKEGIISIYDELVKARPEIFYAIASPNEISSYLGDYFLEHIKKIVMLGIQAKEIIHESGKEAQYLKLYKKPKQEYRILPKQKNHELATDMIIYNNVLAMISYTNDFHAVVIESSAIVDAQKMLFDIVWNGSKST